MSTNPHDAERAGDDPDRQRRPRLRREEEASLWLRLAALLLRRGESIDDIAALTDVPPAMLELMRDEITASRTPASPGPRLEKAPRDRRLLTPLTLVVLFVEVAAVVNIVIGVTAIIDHHADIAVLALVAAVCLFGAVSALSHWRAPQLSRHRTSPHG